MSKLGVKVLIYQDTDILAKLKEVKVGEGMANIPEVLKRLKAVGYTGNLIIEREISGEKQIADIFDTKKYLEEVIATME